jgi:hypothetical protein
MIGAGLVSANFILNVVQLEILPAPGSQAQVLAAAVQHD